MNIIGVDEVVHVTGVFEKAPRSVFATTLKRGVLNVLEGVTLAAAVSFGFVGHSPPTEDVRIVRAPHFTEPARPAEVQWAASTSHLRSLIECMTSQGARRRSERLDALAERAVVRSQSSGDDVHVWATRLASDVADHDD